MGRKREMLTGIGTGIPGYEVCGWNGELECVFERDSVDCAGLYG